MTDRKARSKLPQPSSGVRPKAQGTKREAAVAGDNVITSEPESGNPKKLRLGDMTENIPPGMRGRPRAAPGNRLRRSVSMTCLPTTHTIGPNRRPLTRVPLSGAAPAKKQPLSATNNAAGSAANSGAALKGPAKRAGWDLRGQIDDLQTRLKAERASSSGMRDRCKELETEAADLRTCKEELSTTVQKLQETCGQQDATISSLDAELRSKTGELTTTKLQLSRVTSECESLQGKLEAVISERDFVSQELKTLKQLNCSLQDDYDKVVHANGKLEAHLQSCKEELSQCVDELRRGEYTRRQLHNLVQDLKGNIRVMCRVRPLLLKEEMCNSGTGCITFPDPDHRVVAIAQGSGKDLNESVASSTSTSSNHHKTASHEFSFDRVFDPTCLQDEVFSEISQLVQSSLDGYNVCVFAYGPTGSGKTFTMEGGSSINPSDPECGVIPRCVNQIFASIHALEKQGWTYKVETSFLEIYNETIRDLITPKVDQKHQVKLAKDGDVFVSDLTTLEVMNCQQVHTILTSAKKNRAVAETNCNERSSRSHSVFMLQLQGSNSVTGESCKGTLNLVDLAGSERLKLSGSEGDRLTETKNINKSLSNLGSVILALGQKADHIPYRNSKLTFLLMNSLSGNSKTLMFINISPSEEHYVETLNSLRFAKLVNDCHIGVAQKRKK